MLSEAACASARVQEWESACAREPVGESVSTSVVHVLEWESASLTESVGASACASVAPRTISEFCTFYLAICV